MWWAFSPANMRTCRVTPALVANAMKNSLASEVSNCPSRHSGTSTSQCSWPRPEMSTAASTSVSSMGRYCEAKRFMPRFSPMAWANALPSTMPTSSTVWWASTSMSPFALTERSNNPCRPKASSIWSKKAIPVSISVFPVPSMPSEREISVSFVVRVIFALRLPAIRFTPVHPGSAPTRPGIPCSLRACPP